MAEKRVLLQPDKYYHIYNRGINSTDLFYVKDNYRHFLNLYEKYIEPISGTFAWVLMKNHFHFLIKINNRDGIISAFPNLQGFENLEGLDVMVKKRIYQQFSNLFNAYTKAINKRYNRTGALFESNFHRKEIENIKHFKNLVIYINNNPVHHEFCEHPEDYPWSSYNAILSHKPTKLKREIVINWFKDIDILKELHNNSVDFFKIDKLLELVKTQS